MKTAGKKKLRPAHLWRSHSLFDGTAGVFSDCELHRLLRFAVNDRHALARGLPDKDVANFEANQIAAAKFAVDGEFEESKVAQVPCHLEANPDRPDFFRLKWAFLPEDAAFVPCGSLRFEGGKVDFDHDISFDLSLPTPCSAPADLHIVASIFERQTTNWRNDALAQGSFEPIKTDAARSTKVGFADAFSLTCGSASQKSHKALAQLLLSDGVAS